MKVRFALRARPRHAAATTDEARVVGAALVLAVVLFGLSLPEALVAPPGCAEPRMLVAVDDSPAVVCDAAATGFPRLRGPARLLFGQTLDLNRASARSLEVLPGIGPRRAAAIVLERQARRFDSIEGLRRVPGIGPRTVSRLAGWVAVPGRASAPDGSPAADRSRYR
jgi:hypothetical protein